MALNFEVLGGAGKDNALLVRIDSGQKLSRLLFDCGEGCLNTLSVSEIQAIDHILFSHFHMDHVSGFDALFRIAYDRTTKENIIWGPPGTGQIMHHRFQGFLWNLHEQLSSQWYVNDIYPDRIECTRFAANEAFTQPHPARPQPFTGLIIDTPEYSVEAYPMDHLTPSTAYIVREKPRTNVDTSKLASLGLRPGSWLKQIKESQTGEHPTLELEGREYALSDLRRELLTETSGQSLAYLTDFLMDDLAQERLIPVLQGCTYMICESQYRHADLELAQRNYHMTATQAAGLASKVNAHTLILFHVSDRYEEREWFDLLDEARTIFPNTHFPSHWFVVK